VVFFPGRVEVTGELLQREQYAKGGIGRWYWDLRDERTLSCIGPEKDILDLGCGEGITLEKILRRFPDRHVLGIDYAGEKIRICQERHLPARQGSAYALDLEDQSWDCCLLLEVIEHLEEPQKALREVHRVLRKGGLFLLIFPHDWLFKAARLGFLKFKEAFAPSGHVKQWTPEEMRRTLKGVGFEIQAEVCMPFGFWWCSLHCLMVARKR
jgi:ubiquinone/menaquinone biosynthesis C-methylase UbiE